MMWMGRPLADLTDDELHAAIRLASHRLGEIEASPRPAPLAWHSWLNAFLALDVEATRRDD